MINMAFKPTSAIETIAFSINPPVVNCFKRLLPVSVLRISDKSELTTEYKLCKGQMSTGSAPHSTSLKSPSPLVSTVALGNSMCHGVNSTSTLYG